MVVLAAGIWSGGMAAAQSCGYTYCWGAVGFGPNGAYGYSHGFASEDEALAVAQDGCGYNCTHIKAFANGCGAMAVGATGGWGWGVSETSDGAEETAYAYCSDNDYDCGIVVSNCSY